MQMIRCRKGRVSNYVGIIDKTKSTGGLYQQLEQERVGVLHRVLWLPESSGQNEGAIVKGVLLCCWQNS